MVLLPQDVVVVLKLLADGKSGKRQTFAQLGRDLAMSASQVFRSVERAEEARLLRPATISAAPGAPLYEEPPAGQWANESNLKEFLIHGVKYAFPVERGGPTRGIPTAEAAPPLAQHFAQDFQFPPVWPHPRGLVRGITFSPLSKNIPEALESNPDAKLYELLALLDAIREGRTREREIAIRILTARIDAS